MKAEAYRSVPTRWLLGACEQYLSGEAAEDRTSHPH